MFTSDIMLISVAVFLVMSWHIMPQEMKASHGDAPKSMDSNVP